MSLTLELTNRAGAFLESRTSRRGFVGRTALVASAVSVTGTGYVLRPVPAYAAICSCPTRPSASNRLSCNCGDLCCDGYTEFCCHLYGHNSCPPDTILAGWWKVDNSSFCDGAARYYMDCNKLSPDCSCGSRGVCRDSSSVCQCRSCSNRADSCTLFRYGNCNNDVLCVGPIVCRVVTCTKPWEIDPGCSTVPRTDQATANHHRACLVENVEATPESIAWAWAMHRDYLGREPSEAELETVAVGAAAGRNRAALSRSFAQSETYIKVFVADTYQRTLRRQPDADGLRYWTSLVENGTNPTDVGALLFGSEEYYARGGSDAAFVTNLYRDLLGRDPDQRGLDFWTTTLADGASPITIAHGFYASRESREQRVTQLYHRFLDRPPEQTGLRYWADLLASHDDLTLATFLTGSDEYYQRAQRRFR